MKTVFVKTLKWHGIEYGSGKDMSQRIIICAHESQSHVDNP